jgi:hypothetical protein
MEFLKIIIDIIKRIEDENIFIQQTRLIDEIKWFICLFNLITFLIHANMTYHLLE